MDNIFEDMFRLPDLNPRPSAEEADKARIARRRAAILAQVAKAQQGNRQQGEVIGGGGGGDIFGPRPGIYAGGNTALSAAAEAVTGYFGARENEKLDAAEAAAEQERRRQHEAWLAKGEITGGNGSNLTAVPPPPDLRGQVETALIPQADAQMARNQQALSNPTDADRAYLKHNEAGPVSRADETAPKGRSDQEQLRWLLEGAMIDAPGAKTLLNQAGGQLLTGEAKRETALQLAEQKLLHQAQLQSQRLEAIAQAAYDKAETQAQRDQIAQDFKARQAALDRELRAALHNSTMAFNREKAAAGGGNGGVAKTTEGERKAAGYLGRMEAVEDDPATNVQPSLRQTLVQSIPGVGGYAQALIGTDAENVGRQKQVDFVRAKLRHESGAVIGEKEAYDEAAMYFPRYGDSEAVKAAKAQARKQALEQMRSSAGGAVPTRAAPLAPTKSVRKQGNDGKWYVHDGKGWLPE